MTTSDSRKMGVGGGGVECKGSAPESVVINDYYAKTGT